MALAEARKTASSSDTIHLEVIDLSDKVDLQWYEAKRSTKVGAISGNKVSQADDDDDHDDVAATTNLMG